MFDVGCWMFKPLHPDLIFPLHCPNLDMHRAMPLKFNLHQLERDTFRLQGELPAADLDLDTKDVVIRVTQPLAYDLELQQMEEAVLVTGTVEMELDCECVRCLKPFRMPFALEHWACHIPLEGEDNVLS